MVAGKFKREGTHVSMGVCALSPFQPFGAPWTVPHEAPLSTGFPRQEYWTRLSFPPPGDLPDPGRKPKSPVSYIAGRFYTT